MSELLKEAREAIGWTQQDLAKKSAVGRARISQIENGSMPSVAIGMRLAKALGLDVSDLWPEKPKQRKRLERTGS